MSKVILGRVARKAKPNRTVKSPTDAANPGELVDGSRKYEHNGTDTTGHDWLIPSGTSAGDMIWAAIQVFGGSQSITSKPSGYTALVDHTNTNVDAAQDYVFYKIADGTETDATFEIASGDKISALFWRTESNGVTFGTPEVVFADTTMDPSPITPSAAGDYAVYTVSHVNKGQPSAPSTGYEQVGFAFAENVARRPKTYVQQNAVAITTSEDPGLIDWADTGLFRAYRTWTIALRLDVGTPALATGDHTHVEADVTDLDHWTEADHDALDHTGLTGVGVSDHGALTGLADDDHTQYLLAAGTRAATYLEVSGLTGATGASPRFVGGTTTGAPASGTFQLADFVVTEDGSIYVCTAAGSPGTWVSVAGSGSLPTGTTKGDLAVYNGSSWVRLGAGANDTVLTADSAESTGLKWASGGGGGGQAVPYRVQYLAERVTGETSHTDDLFFATESSLTGTAVDGAGAGTGTWSLTDGQLKLIVASNGGSGAREPKARAWAITSASAPMTIETHAVLNGFLPSSHSPAVMLGFSDGTTTGSNIANVYSYLGLAGMLEAHGTFNSNGFSGFNDTVLNTRYDIWQRVVWVSANTFQMQVAITSPYLGVLLNWTDGGVGTLSKTMTPTHYWVGASNDASTAMWVSWDYVRVYDSDLSV